MRLGAFRYFGEEVWRRRDGDVVLTETAYAVGTSLPVHTHRTAHDALVLEGAYLERIADRAYLCLPGDLVSYPPDVYHENVFGSRLGRVLNLESSDDAAGDGSITTRSLTPAEASAIATLSRASEAKDWIRALRSRLDDDPYVSLGVLADEAGYHPVYVARKFRQAYGCSVGQYAQNRRLKRASELILQSDLRLSEVASLAGYYDQSQMTNELAQRTGFRPNELRRLA